MHLIITLLLFCNVTSRKSKPATCWLAVWYLTDFSIWAELNQPVRSLYLFAPNLLMVLLSMHFYALEEVTRKPSRWLISCTIYKLGQPMKSKVDNLPPLLLTLMLQASPLAEFHKGRHQQLRQHSGWEQAGKKSILSQKGSWGKLMGQVMRGPYVLLSELKYFTSTPTFQ